MAQYVRSSDSRSLWNYTTAPGWTQEEAEVMRLALIRFGVGAWSKIGNSGVLPGKTLAQMNNQVQRMVGQQSLGEFMGIHLDCRAVFSANKDKEGKRKNGCLVNEGANPTKESRAAKRKENTELYGLSDEQQAELCPDEELFKIRDFNKAKEEPTQMDSKGMSREEKVALLLKLRTEYKELVARKAAQGKDSEKKEADEKDTTSEPNKKPRSSSSSPEKAPSSKPTDEAEPSKTAKATPPAKSKQELDDEALARQLQEQEEDMYGEY